MNYIAYYRVSTRTQGNSGLGLEAQKTAVRQYIKPDDSIINEYTEIESGKNNNRTELIKALKQCKQDKAILIIAKLDRLSRNIAFIFQLRDSGVDFVCCDIPQANTMTIGIMAILAQQERELISERTKKALAEKKKQGVKLGKPEHLTDKARLNSIKTREIKANTNDNNVRALAHIILLKDKGHNYSEIANELNNNNFMTSKGKRFTAKAVTRLYYRHLEVS